MLVAANQTNISAVYVYLMDQLTLRNRTRDIIWNGGFFAAVLAQLLLATVTICGNVALALVLPKIVLLHRNARLLLVSIDFS